MSKKRKRIVESDSSFDFEESDTDTDIDIDYTLEDDSEISNMYNLRNTNIINYKDNNNNNNSFVINDNDCKLMKKIKKKINSKRICKNDILKSNMPLEQKVWFIEHIKILHNLEPNTFEYYELQLSLFNKMSDYNKMSLLDIELEERINKINEKKISLKQKILKSPFDDNTKALIFKRYELMISSIDGEEKQKHLEWIDWVLSLPIKSKDIFPQGSISNNLLKIQKKMDSILYGMRNAKERVLEIVTGIYSNSNSKNRCIALMGPPGVGKTVLAKCIAESLNLPFSQISLGGANDSSFLKGHSSTYIGSRPGAIVSSLNKMKYKNGLIFFDELDKLQNTPEGSEVKSTLLHILDYSQNNNFRDNYMPEVPLDLSNIFFIISLNSLNNNTDLDRILADRIPIVKIDGYNSEDRLKIAKNYIIPKIMKNLNIKSNEIIFSTEIIEFIISKQKKFELGVRQLERNIRIILERINLLKSCKKNNKLKLSYNINDFKLPFILKKKHIKKLFNE